MLSLWIEPGSASKPYEPIQTANFDESWRWRELEALTPYTVRQVDHSGDGTLWFAIHGGILEFDGYRATPYWFEDAGLGNANSLAIKVASDGAVYVLTNQFFARFRDGVWHRYGSVWRLGSTGSGIDESADGSIWVVARVGPIATTGSARMPDQKLYRTNGDELELIDDLGQVNGVKVDGKNRLWLSRATTGEIMRYELDWSSGTRIGDPWRISTEEYAGGASSITEFHEGTSGKMWIASTSEAEALRYVYDDSVYTALSSWAEFGAANRSLTEMADGTLWAASSRVLGNYRDGAWSVKRMDSQVNWFTFLYNLDDDIFITGGNTDKTYTFDVSRSRWNTYEALNFGCQESDGTTWFLSEDKRVVRWNPVADSWISYGEEDGLIDQPNAMLATTGDRIWVSGSHGEAAAVSWFDGKRWKRDIHPEYSERISHASPYEGKDGYIYFGSDLRPWAIKDRTGGIIRYRVSNGGATSTYLTPPDFPVQTFQIAQMSNGDLWTGGYSLYRIPEGQPRELVGEFESYTVDNVVVDSNDTLWIGDWRSGVSRLVDGKWERFSISEGRARDQLVSLLAVSDSPGVWAATTDGLGRFDGDSWSQHTRFPELRLQREGARLHESQDGRIWINSASRSWNLNVEPNSAEALVEFKTIHCLPDDAPPETRIDSYESKLPESGNAYFEWSGVDAWSRTWSKDLEYSYRLNAGAWSPFKKTGSVSIPSLAPGDYRLEVRARDADWNIDPSPASVNFSVAPFLWKRPWFLGTVFFTVGLVVTLAYLLERNRVRHLVALEEFKIDFFTNISHELRTPLAVILGPLESLMRNDFNSKVKEKLEMAYRNARKMQGLVNQLLEFRKIELCNLDYEPVRSDIVLFLKDAVYSHAALWEEKRQRFTLECSEDRCVCCYDPEKLQHIVGNLVSNAIKYTHEGGDVKIEIDVKPLARCDWRPRKKRSFFGITRPESKKPDSILIVRVSDSGIGIAAKRQKAIFRPFYRARDIKRDHEGSGIGLAYTYELVQLWGGEIIVESPVPGRDSNAGTRFTVWLPITEHEGAPVADMKELAGGHEIAKLAESNSHDSQQDDPLEEERERPLLLVVEDNSDVRRFLVGELESEYEVLTAIHGKEGLQISEEQMPDLIVTDVMMPEMDGLEMCEELRKRTEICHIPILMLTARGSDEHRIKGIETGADDYFAKPVNIEMLKTRIESLLESRRLLKELFTRQIVVKPKEIAVTSADETLLTKAIAIVEEHIKDESFDVEQFARAVGMARTSLYKKLEAIVGQTPFKFIRSIRLKRAAQLLRSGNVNVGEAMVEVGIKGLSHFGKIFRDEYGMSPSEYRKENPQKTEVSQVD